MNRYLLTEFSNFPGYLFTKTVIDQVIYLMLALSVSSKINLWIKIIK